jgi:hypothetical protein
VGGLRAGGAKLNEVHVPLFSLAQHAHGLRAALEEACGVGDVFKRSEGSEPEGSEPEGSEQNKMVRMTAAAGACMSEVVQASYLEMSGASTPDPNAAPKPRPSMSSLMVWPRRL